MKNHSMKSIAIKIVLLFAMICFVFSNSDASAPLQQFENANKAYRSGDYPKATQLYEALISSGQHSSEIYFNNGNGYYKMQNFPSAILNYERAKRIDPLDEDLNYNLKIAYANTVDKIEPIPLLFYERWGNAFLLSFRPSTWSWIAIVFLWISLAFGIWYLFAQTISTKKSSFLTGSCTLILALLIFALASCSHKKNYGQKSAIVMDANTYIKSSPDIKSTNLFMLHGGTKIEVLDEASGWKKIRIANGNSGWVEGKSVAVI